MIPLFTTLYGSMLYGTSTPESDEDKKVIVLPDLRRMMLGKVPKNKVKGTNKKEFVKNSAEDTDEEIVPIQVFAKDVLDGQTYALELVWAVDYSNAGQKLFHPKFVEFCHELRSKFTTSSMRPMIGYAVNQATLYSAKGERLNAVEDLMAAINSFQISFDEKFFSVWDELTKKVQPLADKYPMQIKITDYKINPQGDRRPCIKILEKILPAMASFEHNYNTIEAIHKKYGARAKAAQEDEIDWKATAHALRIIDEGITILSGKPLVYPYDKAYCERFLSIKPGEIDHKIIMKEITDGLDKLQLLQSLSGLPEKTQALEQSMYDWLYSWLLIFYYDLEGVSVNKTS
jgi:hypothetical protein